MPTKMQADFFNHSLFYKLPSGRLLVSLTFVISAFYLSNLDISHQIILATSIFITLQLSESFSLAENSILLCGKCSTSNRIALIPKVIFSLRSSSINSDTTEYIAHS